VSKVINETDAHIFAFAMKKKIRVGAVSYLNTKPLIYGFDQGAMKDEIELVLDYPSRLVSLLQKDEIDIALLPTAAISNIKDAQVFSNYCIASDDEVASVCLFSQVPIEEIQEIFLDYQSKTSVTLLRILLKNYWQTRPSLVEAEEGYIEHIKDKKGGVIIGDRALEQLTNFEYVYDLAKAWKDYTQLPFVFATWVSREELPATFIDAFNKANQVGLNNLEDIIKNYSFPHYDLHTYYNKNIAYTLNEERRKGMMMFLKMIPELDVR
jgi:chorismate dehydratase